MIEILVAGSLVAGLMMAAVRGQTRHHGPATTVASRSRLIDLVDVAPADSDSRTSDLPCPWCLAPTAETDVRCPSCGQRFG